MPEPSTQKLDPKILYEVLAKNGVEYFCGVPDSLVSSFIFFLETNVKDSHDVAANEGNAIGMAIGFHVATRKVPLVYMQNSGFNNAIDPLGSLTDKSVLGIPMLLLISWRGQPGKTDEPQHSKQGDITCELLKLLDIPYVVLSRDAKEVAAQIELAIKTAKEQNRPYAFLVEKDSFEKFGAAAGHNPQYPLSREEALGIVLGTIKKPDVVVSGVGKISREVFEYREANSQEHLDLLVVGGMGHASSIALGVAMQKKDRRVYCLDGDGSVLMHMGALSTIGSKQPTNFCHIVFNNGTHDSVGGQPTTAYDTDLIAVAKASGYKNVFLAVDSVQVTRALKKAATLSGPILIEIRIHGGARDNLSRPSLSPQSNKDTFMSYLNRQTN